MSELNLEEPTGKSHLRYSQEFRDMDGDPGDISLEVGLSVSLCSKHLDQGWVD